MHEREKVLKEQLNMYTEKYADFQTSLQKSNDVFSTYKNEIEKVGLVKCNYLYVRCFHILLALYYSNGSIGIGRALLKQFLTFSLSLYNI